MVKRLSTLLIALGALAAAPGALAAELSLAVVDVQAAIGQTREAQVFLERVQEELQVEKTRIEERVERDGEVMSEEERVRLSEEYDRITSDLQYRAETYQKAVNRRRNELFRQMGPRVEAALDDLVQLEGYDLVVPRNSVIYVNPKHDITRRLTEQLDAKD